MEPTYKYANSNDEIKEWVERNGGKPALIDDPAVTADETGLRIDWPKTRDEEMLSHGRQTTRDISWEEFFQIMEERGLAFMYSDENDIDQTWKYKFVPTQAE